MGLQYTETDFKGKNVHVITSEGGVGRGLQPLTEMLNSQVNNQGGSTVTTYAPAYSFGTSLRRGFVFDDHTEIGNIDMRADHSFRVLMWQTDHMNTTVVLGKTMKHVVQGITSIVGRMRRLPDWTQQGAIVGLQGG